MESSAPTADRPESRGLFGGFEGYLTPSTKEYEEVLTSGLVVPDANVLLNLYRYNSQAQTDLIDVLQRLGDRLWVPHQVVQEFWRNRENALRDPDDTASRTVEELEKICDQALSVLRRWTNRISLPPDQRDPLLTKLSACFEETTAEVDNLTDIVSEEDWRDTNRDEVLRRLGEILTDRVGAKPSSEAYGLCISEAQRRIEKKVPPGYCDKRKGEDFAAGDYLLWSELLDEAKRRKHDVLLVTGDTKEDWWRKERGEFRGPRLELVDELRRHAGVRLYFLRPEGLLKHASRALKVQVSQESVRTAERVERANEAAEVAEWSADNVKLLLSRLDAQAPTQAAALRHAAKNDGHVSRETVYSLGDYERSRSLRGFTRPIRRILRELQDEGRLPEGLPEVFSAAYNSADSWSRASAFRVPDACLSAFQECLFRSEEAGG